MNNLPILYTIDSNKIINNNIYYIPELNEYVGSKSLRGKLRIIGLDPQNWYDRWVLNITTPSQRPKCIVCGSEAKFRRASSGYYKTCSNHRNISTSELMSNMYKDEKLRLMISRSVKKSLNTSEIKDKHINGIRNSHIKNPDLGKRRGKVLRDRILNDPELKELWSESHRIAALKSWSNPTDKMKNSNSYSTGIKSKIYSPYENRWISLDSNWEKLFFFKMDNNPNVKSVIRVPFTIKYINPNDNDWHNYLPDFLVEYNNGKKELIEIKPNYLLTDPIVKAKESYSIKYCSENNLSYKFITEDHLF